MTTTSERLLQIAEQYDQKAAALRIAANELHEERTLTATKSFGRRITTAIATRAAARANGNGNGRVTKEQRQTIIRDFMSDGATHTISDVMAHLEARHITPGRNIVWLDVKRGIGATTDPKVKFGYRLNGSTSNDHTTTHQAGRDIGGNQTEGRRKVILSLLRRGPQQIKTIQLALNKAGYMIQRDRTRQFIVEQVPEAHCEGTAAKARWSLNAASATKSTATPAKKHKKSGTTSAVRAQRQKSAKFLAQFNTTSAIPNPKGEMKKALGVYVRRGYLQRTDTGYLRTAKEFSLEMP